MKSIFVHVNQRVARLTHGQLAQLDEDDGFTVVGRTAAVHHSLLRQESGRAERVEWDSSSISMKSTTLTTLQTLNDMAHGFLAPGFPDWLPKAKNLVPMRPEDDELRQGQEEFNALLDKLATLPSYRRLEEGIQTGQMRRLKDEGDGGEGHLLFRPVGQTALASALGQLHFDKDNPRELEPLFEKLRRFDDAGGFRMEDPSSLWYMVLYDPNKKRMQIRGERLATRLLVYLLGGLADAIEREELRAALAEEQTIDGKALGFDGEWTDPANIQLPPPL